MIFKLLIILCIASAVATLITFFLYIRARMADRTEVHDSDPDGHAKRLAVLDREERRWLLLHFITLFLFVLFGVAILIHLSDSINSGASYTLLADKLPNFFV